MNNTLKVTAKPRASKKKRPVKSRNTAHSQTFPDENRNTQLQMDEYGPLPVKDLHSTTPKLGKQEAPRPMAHPLTELHVNRIDFNNQTRMHRGKSLNFDGFEQKPLAKYDYSSLVERRSSMASLNSHIDS